MRKNVTKKLFLLGLFPAFGILIALSSLGNLAEDAYVWLHDAVTSAAKHLEEGGSR